MKDRALRLAQKLEWFSGKEIQAVDLEEIAEALAAVRREAVEECANTMWDGYNSGMNPAEIVKAIRALNGPGTKG